jgi:hypothetical protein
VAALQVFTEGTGVAHALWLDAQQALARSLRSRRLARTTDDDTEAIQASKLADSDLLLHRALVEAAAVRLTTSWEVFLSDLFAEYLRKRPSAFKVIWQLPGTVPISDGTIDVIVDQQHHPFQDLGRARKLLTMYLGRDLFGQGAHKIDLDPVEELLLVRHAVVHRAGKPTKQFHKKLETRKTAHGYLVSRVGPAGSLPATQFERLLGGVTTAAYDLHKRAFQRPRPH